jgi:hypothetical protein
MHVGTVPLLFAMGGAYAITYFVLVWRFNLLNESERLAIAGWARKLQAATAGAFDYGKG